MHPFLLAPMVVALRLPLLGLEAFRRAHGQPARPGVPESERMVSEKIAAAQEGAMLAGVEISRLCAEATLKTMFGDFNGAARVWRRGPQRVAAAAARPGFKRVRGNVRRLSGIRL